MALDKATAISALIALFDEMEETPTSNADFASDLMDIIDTYVKSGTVNTTVTVTDPISGPLAGTGTGSVS